MDVLCLGGGSAQAVGERLQLGLDLLQPGQQGLCPQLLTRCCQLLGCLGRVGAAAGGFIDRLDAAPIKAASSSILDTARPSPCDVATAPRNIPKVTIADYGSAGDGKVETPCPRLWEAWPSWVSAGAGSAGLQVEAQGDGNALTKIPFSFSMTRSALLLAGSTPPRLRTSVWRPRTLGWTRYAAVAAATLSPVVRSGRGGHSPDGQMRVRGQAKVGPASVRLWRQRWVRPGGTARSAVK